MAAPIEQLLKSAKALNAERLVLEAGKSAFVWTKAGTKELTKTQLTPYDIFKLISPIMPEDKKVALVGQPSTEFQYSIDGVGDFNVTVVKESNGIKVIFKHPGESNSEPLPELISTQPFVRSQPVAKPNNATPSATPVASPSGNIANPILPKAQPIMAQPAPPLAQPAPPVAQPSLPKAQPIMAQPVLAQPASPAQPAITKPPTATSSTGPVAQPSLPTTVQLSPTVILPNNQNSDATVPLNPQQRAAVTGGRPAEARSAELRPPEVKAPEVRPPAVTTPPAGPPLSPLPTSTPISPLLTTGTGMGRTQISFPERERVKLEVERLLERTVKLRGSDLHLATGAPPIVRRFGSLIRLEGDPLDLDKARVLIRELLTEEQYTRFEKTNDLDFSYEVVGLGRFRANVLRQYRGIDLTFHTVPADIQTPEELGLPSIVREVTRHHQGLILITGAAGQGKSTTISSLVDVINSERPLHIITIEDPIEFVHPINKKAVVNQREVGRHTHSFANALRAALREDPDVIVVGEMRDLETISLAITAAETGHLVMGTLMTSSAHQTIDRILESFPPNQQNQIRMMLSESLRAVVSQRLLPLADESGMVLAAEILISMTAVANLIRDKKTYQIPSIMQTNRAMGMRRMDDALIELVEQGKITPQKGLEFALDKKAFEAAITRR
ncbi:MAG: PilT/PilU family type 4a pilus ATPase [Acidobacteriota bacterium]